MSVWCSPQAFHLLLLLPQFQSRCLSFNHNSFSFSFSSFMISFITTQVQRYQKRVCLENFTHCSCSFISNFIVCHSFILRFCSSHLPFYSLRPKSSDVNVVFTFNPSHIVIASSVIIPLSVIQHRSSLFSHCSFLQNLLSRYSDFNGVFLLSISLTAFTPSALILLSTTKQFFYLFVSFVLFVLFLTTQIQCPLCG